MGGWIGFGRMAGWVDGWVVLWLDMVGIGLGWLNKWLVGQLDDWMAGQLDGWMTG